MSRVEIENLMAERRAEPVVHYGGGVLGSRMIADWHELTDSRLAGVFVCDWCGRIVIRGMGEWWRTHEERPTDMSERWTWPLP